MKTKQLGSALAGLVLTAAGIAFTATPAAAATSHCGVLQARGSQGSIGWYDVNNRCISGTNVRVIFDNGPDSACTYIAGGSTHRFVNATWWSTYNRIDSC
ncbi:hypothetical protein OG897_14615 [Streptomyces sp. NBC_00237]|uniref:hypothetical protein n=1 Tax=Streptomyces sp. NBC_00237 TaxID=2975687 RepID=UPI00225662F0|nr:hypothetical protein [Streptomyces sp. NBC_00237]MCX5202679.1 hypothetical protein [Streptomyces sp. NBC_00237]